MKNTSHTAYVTIHVFTHSRAYVEHIRMIAYSKEGQRNGGEMNKTKRGLAWNKD